MENCDILVEGAREVVTMRGPVPRRRSALDDAGVVEDGALAIREGRIAAVGRRRELRERFRPREVVDAAGGTLLPGFVDPHTHPVFGATREGEFDLRVRGLSYEEITRRGGGIFSSVRSLRETPTEALESLTRERLWGFLRHGTTTIEAKSGYGLSLEHEIRSLEALRRAGADVPLDVLPTFLGAHQMPEEFGSNREGYVEHLVREALPEVRRRGLARACDVFCDEGVYTVAEARRILEAARGLGFALRVHADELALTGAARLAAELGAESADHLCRLDDEGIDALAKTNTAAVLLPGTVLSLGARALPPARRLIERGAVVALATDYNPGTSFTQSMSLVVALACTLLRMTAAEALAAATIQAAFSLGVADRVGSLEEGKQADVVLWDRPSHLFLAYELGENACSWVMKAGDIVYRRGAEAS